MPVDTESQVARSLQLKKAKLCFKKGQILDFTKQTFGKKAKLNKPRLEEKANYIINVKKFQGQLLKKGQICYIWPRKGQPGNPELSE